MKRNDQQAWEAYREEELSALRPILGELHLSLEERQPHIKGERFLMQAVTTASGRKLILLGKNAQGERVVIKATRDKAGAREITHERACRALLADIGFAYEIFRSPEELLFVQKSGFTISVQRFIEQESAFIDRSLKEQFALALSAFKAQEGAHAATYEHLRRIRSVFGSMDASAYLTSFRGFMEGILASEADQGLSAVLQKAHGELQAGQELIEQYTGFLTHTDFVPHNIRIVGSDIYLLDHSSLRFGNKYEGWARFLNFMALYNPPLAEALTEYVRLNRAPEELAVLRLMRIYRLGEIVWYYVRARDRSDGDLKRLNEARVGLWTKMLTATLGSKRLSEAELASYRALRDSLRSDDERERQVGLH